MNLAVKIPQHEAWAPPDAFELMTRDGFAIVPVDPIKSGRLYHIVVDGVRRLTDDPTLGAYFPFRTIELDAYGKGYEQEAGLRLPDPKKDDIKYVFQSTPERPGGLDWAPPAVLAECFRALALLDCRARMIAASLAHQVDVSGTLTNLLEKGRCITRVNRYCFRKHVDSKPDAKPHVDRGFLAVHHWSSHRGLRLRSPQGTVQAIDETSPASVVVFPGEKFAAITRGAGGFGTIHGVRDDRRSAVAVDECDRYSIVSFIHPATRLCDAAWLRENKHLIEAFERSCEI